MVLLLDSAARPAPPRVDSHSPNRLAQQITGRPYLSYSQVAMLHSCPRKFAFQYVENAPRDFVPAGLLLGGSVHAALEAYFRAKQQAREAHAELVMEAYYRAWQRQRLLAGDGVPIRFNKNEDEQKVHSLACRILAAFLASPLAFPKGHIVGVEEQLKVALDPQLPDLLTKVDLVTQDQDTVHVTDWKTSRSRWNRQRAQENGEQLLLYGATVAPLTGTPPLPIELNFAIITKAKSPQVQLLPVRSDAMRLDLLTETLAQVWGAIQGGNFYPSPSSQNCTSCPYRSRCPTCAGG
jgi:hypothetical protein